MSYQSITICTRDQALQDRVTAAALKESYAGGPEFSQTTFATQLQRNPPLALNYFMWPIAIANEADYAYALDTNNENPGGDTGVIGDDEIQSGIQANWPQDQVPVPQPEMFPPEE